MVAKLDRLSRDLHFILGLQKSGVSFVCADMPEMDEFTAHIFSGESAAMKRVLVSLLSSRLPRQVQSLSLVQRPRS